MRNKAPFFAESQDYVTLEGESLYQFSNADTAKWIYITSNEACSVVRCGKNLMRPVGNMPLTITSATALPAFILRTAYLAHYKEILKHPRTYSFSISKNTTTSGYIDCQENTNEYATGYMRIAAGKTGNFKTYITNISSTYKQSSLVGCFYFANKTVQEGEEVEIGKFMCALGNDNIFEPYRGETLSLKAGETAAVSALDGINTIIGSAGALTVQYTKRKED